MMDSSLLLQKKQFPCTFSVHCQQENAREEAVDAFKFTLLTAAI